MLSPFTSSMRPAARMAAAALAVGVAAAAVDPLTVGLIGYLACDGDLRVVTPAGEECEAGFQRHSQAFTDDLREVPVNEPRFVPGRYGLGLLLEPGYESAAKYECRNWLGPEAAQVLSRSGSPPPFVPVGGASLGIIQAADDERCGPREPILEGRTALHVTCADAVSGAETRVPVSLLNGSYTASVFVRGDPGSPEADQARLEVLAADRTTVLGSAEQAVTTEWRRLEVNLQLGVFTRDIGEQAYTPVVLRVTGDRPGQIVVLDAFMLELRGGYSYAGTMGASTWLPGLAYRAAEVLDLDDLRPGLAARAGSVAFALRLRGGPQVWRTLFELASPNRWEPHLQVRLAGDRRLHLGRRREKPQEVFADVSVVPETWYHLAVVWSAERATVYLDGTRAAEIDGLEIPLQPAAIRLASGGPNAAANAVLDEVLIYDRAVTEAEVQRLARTPAAGAGLALPTLTLRPRRFVECIAHSFAPQSWACTLRNAGADALAGVDVSFRLGPALALTRRLDSLPAGSVVPVEFRFLADLAVGSYPLAAEPAGNLQVLPWQRTFDRAYGFTCGGGDLAETMRQGLAWAPHHHYLGYPRALEGDDLVHDMNGKPGHARLNSPFIVEQVRREAVRFAERAAGAPALRAVTFNSEVQWIWTHDYSPENVAWVRQTFHLDLDAWRNPPQGEADTHQLPFGRLRPALAGLARPADGMVEVSTPFYSYHRWFHGPLAPTETFLNQALSDELLARRPEVLTIQEPILRRPAVRAFDRVRIAQEWFYYQNPMAAVMVQECLNAAVRNTGLRPSGMPQFLFKAGTAAPYNGAPTADLFREAAWLCAVQPIRLFTYWNFDIVPRPDFENAYHRCLTKAQIDELLGSAEPSWDEAKRILEGQAGNLASKLMPWTPELVAAFTRFHRDEVGPLGALIPEWRNRPRRVAILRSFASQLYGDVRWPGTTWLETCVLNSGAPFDVLLDEDFEGKTDPLTTHQLVVVSAAACLPRPLAEGLQRFAARGGVIVTDTDTRVALPAAHVLRPSDTAGALSRRLGTVETELRARQTSPADPRTVEAMTSLAEAGALDGLPEPAFLDLFETSVTPEARTLSPFTWLNLLEAEGACYLAVVNDLRVHGPIYGHFGAVRETGVPHNALVHFSSALAAVAYDLLSHEPVALAVSGTTTALALDLPPAGARVLVLLPAPIGRLEVQAELAVAQWGDHQGRQVSVRALLQDAQGRIVPGLIPATVTWLHPDGSRSDFSHHTVFRRGALECALPVLANGPAGAWRVQVLERASGRVAEVTVAVP
jgi:hypothetical protein